MRGCGTGKGEGVGVVLILGKGGPCRCESVVLADKRVRFLPRKVVWQNGLLLADGGVVLAKKRGGSGK